PQGADRLKGFVDAAEYFMAAGSHEAALSSLNEALRAANDGDPLGLVQLKRGVLLERAGDPAAVGAFQQALEEEAHPRAGHVASAVSTPMAEQAAQGLERMMSKPLSRTAAA